jgi:hypothetical protein
MTNFKGTKGKWILRQFPEGQMSVRTVDDSRKICVSRVHNYEESEANLLLISKSPQMLEMLEKLTCANPIHEGYHQLRLEAINLIKEATSI